MREAIERLIEDYERRIISAEKILDQEETNETQWFRVSGKREAYNVFIRELKAVLSDDVIKSSVEFKRESWERGAEDEANNPRGSSKS